MLLVGVRSVYVVGRWDHRLRSRLFLYVHILYIHEYKDTGVKYRPNVYVSEATASRLSIIKIHFAPGQVQTPFGRSVSSFPAHTVLIIGPRARHAFLASLAAFDSTTMWSGLMQVGW